jgi:DNA-binding transcriptional ArsR family regulator
MFAALADPARRGVVDLLRKQPRRAGELASALAISAPRMSQQMWWGELMTGLREFIDLKKG